MTLIQVLGILFQVYYTISWCFFNTLTESNSQINQVDWSPDGQFLSVSSNSKTMTVYHFTTLSPVLIVNLSNNGMTAKFSKLGKYLAVGSTNNDTVSIYYVPNFTLYTTYSMFASNAEKVYQVDFSPDDTKMVACGSNNFVTNVNVAAPPTLIWRKNVQGKNSKIIWSCKYSDVGDTIGLVCATCTNYVHFYINASSANPTLASLIGSNTNYDADFQPGSGTVLYSALSTGTNLSLLSFTLTNKTVVLTTTYTVNAPTVVYNPTNGGNIYAISASLDKTFIAIGMKGNKNVLGIYNLTSNSLDFVVNYSTNAWAVRVSDNSNYVAVGLQTGNVDIYKRNCFSCKVGQYLNISTSTCKLCQLTLPGCASCANSTYCYNCYLGYFINTSPATCIQCALKIPGCAFCLNNVTCQQCTSSYYLSAGTCKRCSTNNVLYCQQCSNNGTCTKCGYMTYLNNNTCNMCNNSLNHCIHCYPAYTSSTTASVLSCVQCQKGYYVLNAICVACPAHCVRCFGNGSCAECAHQFQLNASTNGCSPCSVKYCLSCDGYTGVCKACAPATTLISGSCTLCSAPCATCSSSATTCSSCEVGYFLNGTNCIPCQNCQLCNPLNGTCLVCPIAQYLNTATNTCVFCLNTTSHCILCSDSTTCLGCQRNFVLSSNKCIPITTIFNCMVYQKNSVTMCQQCTSGFYLDTGNTSCSSCPFNCDRCSDATTCLSCVLQYYFDLNTYSCQPCHSPCLTCSSLSVCLSCGNDYYLSGSSCVTCGQSLPNCYKCLNDTTCLSCFPGYYVGSNYTCVMCTPPCASCSNSATGCLSCIIGYYYSANSCIKCTLGCATCTSTDCTSCITGYTLMGSTSPIICKNCSQSFSNCQYCNSTNCLVCNSYYMLGSSNTCQKCNIQNCVQCDNTGYCYMCSVGFYSDDTSCKNCSVPLSMCQKCANENICDKCMMGYFIDNIFTCSKCMAGCMACTNISVCITCQTGFRKIGNICQTCDQVTPGCRMCNQSAGCILCSSGYYIDANACMPCRRVIQGCADCQSNISCLSCDAGYFKNLLNNCQLCSTQPGCQICNQQDQTCTSCMSGYYLDSVSKCQLCSKIDNCFYCDSQTNCTNCKTGYYLYFDLDLGKCKSCSVIHQFCSICNDKNCLQCQSGYYMTNTSTNCQLCSITGCQICSSNGTICLSCANLYYMVGSVCSYCESMDFGCLTCSGLNQCLICKTGYYLNSNGKCSLCSKGCQLCSQTECIVCQSNYFKNISTPTQNCSICSQFIPGCQLCLNQAYCLFCDSGYYLQSTSTSASCISCTTLQQCMICSDSSTCLFCKVGSYIDNGSCLLCSTAKQGCYSCVSATQCLTCSGNYIMNQGQCIPITTSSGGSAVVIQHYSDIKISCQYINETSLMITLYITSGSFVKIQQNWNDDVSIQLVPPPAMGSSTQLKIQGVMWGSNNPLDCIYIYTDNPFGEINLEDIGTMPMIGSLNRRLLLLNLFQLNINMNLNMKKQVINQILPTLDTNGQDLNLQYNLDSPEFYRSIIQNRVEYYWIFGVAVSAILIFFYLCKICWTVPVTQDAGQIIPHVLLMKVPAMVIYPSFSGYINYCYGFSIIDIPVLNYYFSGLFTRQTDQSPASYKMFYSNINIASTYFLALLVFLVIIIPLTGIMIYKQRKLQKSTKSNKIKNYQNLTNEKLASNPLIFPFHILNNFQSLVYNIFIAGLAFNSFINIIGMIQNPTSTISLNGFFYILGVIVFTAVVVDAIRAFSLFHKKCNRLRVVIKSLFLGVMFYSPIPLFAGMALIDIVMILFEYRRKKKQQVIPKLWLFSQSICLIGYAALIFMSNMKLGIIVASSCIIMVLLSDIYLHYKQYIQAQKILNLNKIQLRQSQQSFSIESFLPDKQDLFNSKSGNLFMEHEQQRRKRQYNEKITLEDTSIKKIGSSVEEKDINQYSMMSSKGVKLG